MINMNNFECQHPECQRSFKEWVNLFLQKYNIAMEHKSYYFLLNKIPESINNYICEIEHECDTMGHNDTCFMCFICENFFWVICDLIGIADHLDDIHTFNTLKMPDRKILYQYLKQIPEDTGMKNYDSVMENYHNVIKKLSDSTPPNDDGSIYLTEHLLPSQKQKVEIA